MKRRTRNVLVIVSISACAFLQLACGPSSSVFPGRGVVLEVRPADAQVVISHEDIPGLMPAMTMNFDVADPKLLAQLAPGQVIDFELEVGERMHRVVGAEVRRWVAPEEGWARLGAVLVQTDPAPDFQLIDQAGKPVSMRDLAGQNVLLDFLYTLCPGPCAIVTGIHRDVQKALPAEVRARTRFVSISMDPVHDTPAVLADYARKHGADLTSWSFLTGPPEAVDALTRAYGIGATRREDREIDHIVVSFLIDDRGRIARRYFGVSAEPEAIAADLRQLSSDPASEAHRAAVRPPPPESSPSR